MTESPRRDRERSLDPLAARPAIVIAVAFAGAGCGGSDGSTPTALPGGLRAHRSGLRPPAAGAPPPDSASTPGSKERW